MDLSVTKWLNVSALWPSNVNTTGAYHTLNVGTSHESHMSQQHEIKCLVHSHHNSLVREQIPNAQHAAQQPLTQPVGAVSVGKHVLLWIIHTSVVCMTDCLIIDVPATGYPAEHGSAHLLVELLLTGGNLSGCPHLGIVAICTNSTSYIHT